MNKPIAAILTLAAAVTLSGCGNTLSGAKQDAATDTAKTQQAADQAGKAVATLPDDAAASGLIANVFDGDGL